MLFPFFFIPSSLCQDRQEMIERQILAIEDGEYGNNKRQTMDDTEININDG
jgi:hypothetical protein